jgi:leader peptidase (prepilin peptidase)/N-methyltransferase
VNVEYLILAAGLALALGFERTVLAWATPSTGDTAEPMEVKARAFAWQGGRWRGLVARAAAAIAVVAVVIAMLRFEDLTAVRVAVISVALVACTATDLLAYRVPDVVTLPATAFALACSAVAGEPSLASALAGATLSAGLLLGAALLTRGGLGGGDVKLGGLIGAALGLPIAAFALAEGILLGGGFVICLFATGRLERTQVFPFAPFLALSGLAYLLGG